MPAVVALGEPPVKPAMLRDTVHVASPEPRWKSHSREPPGAATRNHALVFPRLFAPLLLLP